MATLYDGTPVFAPVAGNTALAADQVTLQAKLILGLEARWQSIPLASGTLADAGGWALNWNAGATPDVWWESTGANSEILFSLWLREGEYLTDANVWVDSTAGNPTGGICSIYKLGLDGTTSSVVDDFGAAGTPDFWDTDGTPTALPLDAGPYAIAAQQQYVLGISSPAVPGGVTSKILGIEIQTRFHEGV